MKQDVHVKRHVMTTVWYLIKPVLVAMQKPMVIKLLLLFSSGYT